MNGDEQRPYGRRAFLGLMAGGLSSLALGRARRAGARAGHLGLLAAARQSSAGRRLADLHDLRLDADLRRARLAARDHRARRRPVQLTYAQLRALPRAEQVSNFHCVTGWSVPNVRWAGVRFDDLLATRRAAPGRRPRSASSRSRSRTTTRLTLDQARLPNVMLAYELDGQPLSRPHGSSGARRDPGDVRLQGRQVADEDGARRPAADRLLGTASATTRTPGSGGRTAMAREPAACRGSARTERAVHWVHATAFLILLGSGLCLYLPSLAEAVSRRPLLKSIHIYTARRLDRGAGAGRPRRRPPRARPRTLARSTASTPTTSRGSRGRRPRRAG